MTTLQIQQALAAAGFDPGPVDGISGRKTIAAIRAFQTARGLHPDGIAGPATLAALTGQAQSAPALGAAFTVPPSLPWLDEAHRLIGTREVPGQGSNAAILGWADALRIDYDDDDVPWCGLFVAHCIGSQLTQEPLPTLPLLARAWGKFGLVCQVPQPGAVMVFWRGSPQAATGHVGLYWGEDDTTFHILGGNQANAVTVARLPRARLLTARWPATALAPAGAPRRLGPSGKPVSTNEQ